MNSGDAPMRATETPCMKPALSPWPAPGPGAPDGGRDRLEDTLMARLAIIASTVFAAGALVFDRPGLTILTAGVALVWLVYDALRA